MGIRKDKKGEGAIAPISSDPVQRAKKGHPDCLVVYLDGLELLHYCAFLKHVQPGGVVASLCVVEHCVKRSGLYQAGKLWYALRPANHAAVRHLENEFFSRRATLHKTHLSCPNSLAGYLMFCPYL